MSSSTFSSNSIRLSGKEWGGVACAVTALFVAFPTAWARLDRFEPARDYRLPYEASNDYWMCRQWCAHAAAEYPFLVLGDSVVWGQYVRPEHTLSHCLNDLLGKAAFANLGIDGLHPAAMAGLTRYYGTRRGLLVRSGPGHRPVRGRQPPFARGIYRDC